jgi:hypothetical protein
LNGKLLDFSEMETMRDQLYKVQDAKDEIQIIVDERDRTIRILNDTLTGKSSELSRLSDENISFREAISKC